MPESPDFKSPAEHVVQPPVSEETYRLSQPEKSMAGETPMPTFTPAKPVAEKKPPKAKGLSDRWFLIGLNVLVFLTSVCVMTLELTASRLIAKTVGSSLYTWTSVIGVVLAGITFGNWLGGWLADRFDRSRSLAWMYLLASASCASVLWLDQIVSPMPRPASFSWPVWIITVVSLMFLLPSLALGTISPLVASMALSRSAKTGSTVGNVYAWGALGSIVGTFLTGFWLIDHFGTRSIVGMTAGTLGVLAAVVAGSGRIFRAAVICGWLQLLGWTVLAATCTPAMAAVVGGGVGRVVSWTKPTDAKSSTRTSWTEYGRSLGLKLHELGLLAKLRDDRVGEYHDESNYSTIVVGDDSLEEEQVKYLRLDKLIHSYYQSDNPTALHYEYEQVYAAVTKRAAEVFHSQPVFVSTLFFPGTIDPEKLPGGVSYKAAASRLKVAVPSQPVFDALLNLAPDAPYWRAINELHRITSDPLWGGFSTTPLEILPPGVKLPESLDRVIRHDATLGVLTAYQKITDDLRKQLIAESPSVRWHRDVEAGRQQSQRSSALFYGGGGYVFPRWYLKEFPGCRRLDVYELDPGVLKAVQSEFGLTKELEQRVVSVLGDARNSVDDRLRDNRMLSQRGESPVLYDFIYGDAFNDFSIPFHLTTREFLQKTNELLTEDGVFQANIIDIYPRTEYPGTQVGKGDVDFAGRLPRGLEGTSFPEGKFEPAGRGFEPLLVKWIGDNLYRLGCSRPITEADEKRLTKRSWRELTAEERKARPGANAGDVNESPNAVKLDVTSETLQQSINWGMAITRLAELSREPIPFEGTIPEKLNASGGPLDGWVSAAHPFEQVEIRRIQGNQHVLGFRGEIDATARRNLIDVDPNNVAWVKAVEASVPASKKQRVGRFMGRYVATAASVFPNIYLFSTSSSQPTADRDTYVMVCSRKPLNLKRLNETGEWEGDPFASLETIEGQSERRHTGQMLAVLALAEGQILTDDFAPVDNLLRAVFTTQE